MFKKGDLVLHRHHGVGTVTNIRKMKVTANEQTYYVIDLAIGERLLIPAREAESLGLSTIVSPEAIISVLSDAPHALADDFRLRQTAMDEKIGSGDPLLIAEALRDLIWRGRTVRLSSGDMRLMDKARKFVSSLLAAQPNMDTRSANRRLDAVLEQTVLGWDARG